ncbi:MAG: hypothetical protein V5A23_07140 [Halobacteriales archaeon]
MAGFLDVLPMKVVALVAVPLLLGLGLLAILFEMGSLGWALILTVVIGGTLLLVMIGAHTAIVEQLQGPVEPDEGE